MIYGECIHLNRIMQTNLTIDLYIWINSDFVGQKFLLVCKVIDSENYTSLLMESINFVGQKF